jgi:hypothetical protein
MGIAMIYKHTRLDRYMHSNGIIYAYCGTIHSSAGPAFIEYDGQLEFYNSTSKPLTYIATYFNDASYNTIDYHCNETGILYIDEDD